MIRKLPSGEYRLYSRTKNPKTGKRRNLGTFSSRAAAQKTRTRRAAFQAGAVEWPLRALRERPIKLGSVI